jgi:hypothetical protein
MSMNSPCDVESYGDESVSSIEDAERDAKASRLVGPSGLSSEQRPTPTPIVCEARANPTSPALLLVPEAVG